MGGWGGGQVTVQFLCKYLLCETKGNGSSKLYLPDEADPAVPLSPASPAHTNPIVLGTDNWQTQSDITHGNLKLAQ